MKFQDSSFDGLKVTVGTKSVTHARTHAHTHARTHARSKSNMPHQLFQSLGHKYKIYITRIYQQYFPVLHYFVYNKNTIF